MAKKAYIGVDNVAHKIKKAYVGVDGVARRIKKAYIGIGGVARPCYSIDGISYMGHVANCSDARSSGAGTSINNHAVFGGGRSKNYTTFTVDAFDASLTRQVLDSLSDGNSHTGCAGSTESYGFFGGSRTSEIYGSISMDAYSTSLVRTHLDSLNTYVCSAAAVATAAVYMVGGGRQSAYSSMMSSSKRAAIDVYNNSLAKLDMLSLSQARENLAAATAGQQILFAGGNSTNSSRSDVVDAFNESLVRTLPVPLPETTDRLLGVSFGDHALFFIGNVADPTQEKGTWSKSVITYDSSLTRGVAQDATWSYNNRTGCKVGNYAAVRVATNNFNFYDLSLTRTVYRITEASDYCYADVSASIGNKVLFTGGFSEYAGEKVRAFEVYD